MIASRGASSLSGSDAMSPGPRSTETAEERRLREADADGVPWRRFGPYLSDRQWGTVREDYSADGNAWDYFTHDQARSRVYRRGEDGLAGLSDDRQLLCFSPALWNGADPILKERLFGLTNSQGNHGEDVKEYYFHLDSTPTHSYMRMLYKYPQAAYPYEDLVGTNRGRSRTEFEYELLDTGVFDDGRYFDVFVEYAKAAPDDVLCRITIANRGPDAAELHVLPTVWWRNTWGEDRESRPSLRRVEPGVIELTHAELGDLVRCTCLPRPSCCSRRTRRTSPGSGVARTRRLSSRTGSTITSSPDSRPSARRRRGRRRLHGTG